MKKVFVLLLSFFYFAIQLNGQDLGIKFENSLSWMEIKQKAKKEQKFIFMDCFATWCAPCKFMSKNIFTQSEVGDFMNKKFVNVAVQMDRTRDDPDYVKAWYSSSKEIESEFSVTAYPTYLFFSPDGQIVHRVVGATGYDPNNFISKAREALKSDSGYYAVVNMYKEHKEDSAYLRNVLKLAIETGDTGNAMKIGELYFKTIKSPLLRDNIVLLQESMTASNGKIFQFSMENRFKIDSVLEFEDATTQRLVSIIANENLPQVFLNDDKVVNFNEIMRILDTKYGQLGSDLEIGLSNRFKSQIKKEVVSAIFKDGASVSNWTLLEEKFQKRFPGFNVGLIIALEKPDYYRRLKYWDGLANASFECLKEFGNEMSDRELNGMAWNVFQYTSNRPHLEEALKWSLRTIRDYPNIRYVNTFGYMDTYANLLYKLGQRDSAIIWENRTIEKMESLDKRVIDPESLNEIKANLSKMQANEITWPGL